MGRYLPGKHWIGSCPQNLQMWTAPCIAVELVELQDLEARQFRLRNWREIAIRQSMKILI